MLDLFQILDVFGHFSDERGEGFEVLVGWGFVWCAWLVLSERVEFGLDVACDGVTFVVCGPKIVESAEDVGTWCFW